MNARLKVALGILGILTIYSSPLVSLVAIAGVCMYLNRRKIRA